MYNLISFLDNAVNIQVPGHINSWQKNNSFRSFLIADSSQRLPDQQWKLVFCSLGEMEHVGGSWNSMAW